MDGEDGMMETEEESGTAPVPKGAAIASGYGGKEDEEEEEDSEEWGVFPPLTANEECVDDIFDPFRFPPSSGTFYEKVSGGAFDQLLERNLVDTATQNQQQLQDVISCLPYLAQVALDNPTLASKLSSLPQVATLLLLLAFKAAAHSPWECMSTVAAKRSCLFGARHGVHRRDPSGRAKAQEEGRLNCTRSPSSSCHGGIASLSSY